MPIEMVGCDVQDDGDCRMKLFNRLQLEAGNLEHIPTVCGRSVHQLDHRCPDISTDQNFLSGMCQNFSRKRGGRGLPIRATDGDDLALQITRRELNLTDDLDSELASLGETGCIN